MYFWDIEGLKSDLRKGPLTASESVAYLIPLFVLQFIVTLALPRATVTGHGDASAVLQAAFWLWGVRGAYVANGGATGVDFIPRLLALWQVHTIRFVVVVGLPLLLFTVFVMTPVFVGLVATVSPSLAKDSPLASAAGTVAGLFIAIPMLTWYWLRLHSHFRSLRMPESGEQSPTADHSRGTDE